MRQEANTSHNEPEMLSLNDMSKNSTSASGDFPGDFLTFRTMIAPVLIQVVFWIGVAACAVIGIMNIADEAVVPGIIILLLGPLVLRLWCELTILFFRMNQTLTDIRNRLN